MMIIQINLTSVQYLKLFNIKQMRHAKNFDFFIHIKGEIYSFNLNKKHFFFKMNMLIVAAASFLPFFGSAFHYNSAIELTNSFGIFDMKILSYYFRLTTYNNWTNSSKIENIMASSVCLHGIEKSIFPYFVRGKII